MSQAPDTPDANTPGAIETGNAAADATHDGAPRDTAAHGGTDAPAIESVIEALLFSSDAPRSVRELVSLLEAVALTETDSDGGFRASLAQVRDAIAAIAERYASTSPAVRLVEVAGGWEFRTRKELAPWLQPVAQRKPVKLGRAPMEVLAVVAYRQPCTRADVDDIRGVDSSSTLRNLLQLKLLKVLGRADDIGRPLVYGTSDEFLRLFSLKSLAELPTLREFSELSEEHLLTLAELDQMHATLDESEAEGARSSTHRDGLDDG